MEICRCLVLRGSLHTGICWHGWTSTTAVSRSVGDFPSGKNLLLKLQAPRRDRQEKILQASLRQSLMFFKEKAPKTCKGPKCLPLPTTRILSEMLSVSQLLRTFIQFAAERPLRSIQNTVAASPRVNKRSSAFDTGPCKFTTRTWKPLVVGACASRYQRAGARRSTVLSPFSKPESSSKPL